MSDSESNVATYLTLDGKVFIAPQFAIAYDEKLQDGGTCPDFVALDLPKKEVIIVEVSEAANISGLIDRIKDRQNRWYNPARRVLTQNHVIDESWHEPRFLGVVRKDVLDRARQIFSDHPDVAFISVEQVAFPWEYWNQRMERGLANNSNQATVFNQ
ncbi:hypothetical protein AA0242T_1789 [Acetobacter aceti NRIC 0242]|uniref:Uncharacterized protein n=1 Tax=Acetobacter aceti NBRC 14818 TaxID=887700 RepID=A0AB33IDX3_ACEAC|nr:hypothetical protein [Acetobacter aceti]TCS33204.1 hypothetical protein EDC15_10889 [Acetobacter aceti NBRC 14818]BCK75734.1 hypothetical protein EMQ_1340 [Acetobacter aceti NBRC 14818]GAN57913.1 hypothetical protein Abac_022_046 [Acetobacter aceti NBRC 14818]GBO81087.1 hypothetical protein AA0242T_1789 [Acetobacter aceti NRIC 0242]